MRGPLETYCVPILHDPPFGPVLQGGYAYNGPERMLVRDFALTDFRLAKSELPTFAMLRDGSRMARV